MPDTNFTHPMRKWEDILTIVSGKNQKNVETDNGQYPIYGSGGIIGRANAFLCEAGTTIVGRKGTINSPIYVSERFWNVDTAFGIVPGPELLPKFLYYFCRHFNFKDLDKSTTIPSLAKRDLLAIKMVVPPLPEQERIVARIEELFSELDKAVETLNTTKQQLAVYRQAVLAFHLTPKDNWRICKASEIGEVCLGRQRSPQNVAKDYPTKYIRAANITEDGLDLSDVLEMEFNPIERKKYFLKYNDIVLSEASGSAKQVGKPAIWKNNLPDCCFQNTVIRHRVIQENPEYVLWYYKFLYTSGYFARIVGGVGINHLGAKNFSNVPIALPELNQQQEIVSRIEAQLSVCGQIEKTIEQSLQQAEALRQSILKQAFEGRL